MRVLFALTYYRPHVSGLTIYVQRLAEALVAQGHQVTVLTSQYDPALPLQETLHGVRVERVPVAFRISKGAIMPGYLGRALGLLREHDVVSINLPNTPIEAALLPFLARFVIRRPITATYHCDVQLPKGLLNRFVDRIVFLFNMLAGLLVDRFVAYTEDYANHSEILRRFPRKRIIIPPPVLVESPSREAIAAFRAQHAPQGAPLIGHAARFATEKGVEYVLDALPLIRERYPEARVLFAGEYRKVLGEDAYWQRLQPALAEAGEHFQLLGVLGAEQMGVFFSACDVTVLPSINSTESFGLVQVESMLSGTPVVASDLPGVRVPVQSTGMGRIVPIADAQALAQAVIEVLDHHDSYRRPRAEIEQHFSMQHTLGAYQTLWESLMNPRDVMQASPHEIGGGPASLTRPPGSVDYLRAHLREEPQFRAMLRAVESQLWDETQIEAPVIDLGCGDGQYAQATFAGQIDAGIDPHGPSIREARQRGVYRLPVWGSATKLPFPDGSFQTAISNSSLEHIPDIESALREAARVLRPGGRLIFCSPSHRFAEMLAIPTWARAFGLTRLAQRYETWFNRHSAHFHTYSADQWRDLLNRCGFETESQRYYMTQQAHRIFDISHYLGIPRLISHRLTGRWVLLPALSLNFLFEAWMRPHTRHYQADGPSGEGPYIFIHARRR